MNPDMCAADWQSIVISMGFLIDSLIKEVASYHEDGDCARMIFANGDDLSVFFLLLLN